MDESQIPAKFYSTIDGRLFIKRKFILAGAAPDADPEYAVLVKAFRWKHYDRCPRCDLTLLWFQNPADLCRDIWCDGCGFTARINDWQLTATANLDDFIIDLVKEAIG
jgi:hypothetical protein